MKGWYVFLSLSLSKACVLREKLLLVLSDETIVKKNRTQPHGQSHAKENRDYHKVSHGKHVACDIHVSIKYWKCAIATMSISEVKGLQHSKALPTSNPC